REDLDAAAAAGAAPEAPLAIDAADRDRAVDRRPGRAGVVEDAAVRRALPRVARRDHEEKALTADAVDHRPHLLLEVGPARIRDGEARARAHVHDGRAERLRGRVRDDVVERAEP